MSIALDINKQGYKTSRTRVAIYLISAFVLLFALFYSVPASATDIDTMLALKQAPAGVVFEIVSDEEDLLEQLLPIVKNDINKLRNRFPRLAIAIVTHGKEQFSLTSENREKEKTTHSLVKGLVESNDIELHVCGTHASWYGITPEDFPGYVDVTAAAPTQIDAYEEMGYELIVLTD